jgi:hypothetical protein
VRGPVRAARDRDRSARRSSAEREARKICRARAPQPRRANAARIDPGAFVARRSRPAWRAADASDIRQSRRVVSRDVSGLWTTVHPQRVAPTRSRMNQSRRFACAARARLPGALAQRSVSAAISRERSHFCAQIASAR